MEHCFARELNSGPASSSLWEIRYKPSMGCTKDRMSLGFEVPFATTNNLNQMIIYDLVTDEYRPTDAMPFETRPIDVFVTPEGNQKMIIRSSDNEDDAKISFACLDY